MSNRLVPGEHYSLEVLLNYSENSKIVMPDLQRDYCWGGKENLVYDFVNNIKKHYNEFKSLICESEGKCKCDNCESYISKIIEDSKLTMGLVYGYYETYRPYLQLCDGQQRLTTLFLLMGLINRRCEANPFQNLLISNFELNEDDKEPNLLYSIRDSSLYFLSDLVSNFFLKDVSESEEPKKPSDVIKQCDWWFADYELDPTIKSMLSAMDTIDELLQDNLDQLKSFGEYIQNQLLFIFYDMGNRQDGEETFVIINTTGEPLTATENLKPLIVTKNDSEYQTVEKRSEKWEEIENWFWINRADDDETADNGMYEFLRLVAGIYFQNKDRQSDSDYYQLLQQDRFKFPYADIELNKIFKLYEAIKDIKTNSNPLFERLCPLLSIPLKKTKYDLKEYFVILPVLFYKIKFKDASLLQIKRVYNFFFNLTRYTDINVSNNNILYALDAIDKLPNMDICNLHDVKNKINTTYVLTSEEELRLNILKNAGEMREELEDAFEEISAHKVLSGRISCLLEWSKDKNNFDYKTFKKYKNKFNVVFNDEYNNIVTNTTALSLAVFYGIRFFPIVKDNIYNFGWESSEWNRIIYGDKDYNNIKVIGDFLDKINEENLYESEEKIIQEWVSNSENECNKLYPLLYNRKLIHERFENNNIIWQKKVRLKYPGIILVLSKNYTNVNIDFYLLGKGFLPCIVDADKGQWTSVNYYQYFDEHLLYFDHKEYDITIDILADSTGNGNYRLRIFNRDNDRKKYDLKEIIESNGITERDADKRAITKKIQSIEIINLVNNIKTQICNHVLNYHNK